MISEYESSICLKFLQEVSGEYFFGGNGWTIDSSDLSYDPKLARELWATSLDLFDELHHAFEEC